MSESQSVAGAALRGWHVLLIGMMGVGKTTTGVLLGRALDRPYYDSDWQVQHHTGRSVPEIFAAKGEAAFRAEEARALAEALSSARPAVVGVAGGAVLDPANRELIARAGQVVWLRARPETLARRVGSGAGRPLLEGDPAGELRRLDAVRRPLYEQLAHLTVDVDELRPDAVVERLVEGLVEPVAVGLGDRSYDVLVGPGARHRLASLVPLVAPGARRVAVVTQPEVPVAVDSGLEQEVIELPDGEGAKTFAAFEQLCRRFAAFGLTRADLVVSVGGGAVSDVAGFAAASFHRGVPVLHVSTTLLGQVDAAIGGKTAINIPEGKNLVGAFWQPAAVICDTDTLATLPEQEWRSGLGEMAKYAFLGAPDLERLPLQRQVRACVALKGEVVAGDERESGRRALLNYGHTLAHALEAAGFATDAGGSAPAATNTAPAADAADAAANTAPAVAVAPNTAPAPASGQGPALRHGEAVAIGLVFAARLARRLGRIDDAGVARHLGLVAGYGLPTELPAGADPGRLIELMRRDKKALTSGLTFVLDGPAGVEVVRGVDEAVVAEVLGAGARGGPS